MIYFTYTADENVSSILFSDEETIGHNIGNGEKYKNVEEVSNVDNFRGYLLGGIGIARLKYKESDNTFYLGQELPQPTFTQPQALPKGA